MEATSSVAIFKIGARFVGEQINYDEFISLRSFGRPHGGDLNSLEINLIASVPEKFVLCIRPGDRDSGAVAMQIIKSKNSIK